MKVERYLLILMYHSLFTDTPLDSYSVNVDCFERQVRYLKEAGFTAVVPETIGSCMERLQVMFSFDDGYMSDFALARPVLTAYGFPGVSFITTSYIGRRGYMGWEELAGLARDFSVQSHTHTHPLLECCGDDEIREELALSKRLLETRLSKPVIGLSLPGGSMPEGIRGTAAAAGYRYVFSSVPGVNPLPVTGALLSRLRVSPGYSQRDFERIAGGDSGIYRAYSIGFSALRGLKKAIGPRAYHAMWSTLRKKERV